MKNFSHKLAFTKVSKNICIPIKCNSMKHILSSILLFLFFTTNVFSQWNGVNPIWTNSRVTVGSNLIPTGTLTIDGAACGGIHALSVRQQAIGCTQGNAMGDLVRVEYNNGMQFIPAFNVTQYGYVGIGTYLPQRALHVEGWGFINGRLGIGIASPVAPFHVIGNGIVEGNFGIGITNPAQALHINNGNVRIDDGDFTIANNGVTQFKVYGTGFVHAREVLVDLQPIPDYVFANNYKRLSIPELEKFIKENKHLPGIKSEDEYKQVGRIAITELSLKLLEKVEEQALYIIELNQKLDLLTKRLDQLEKD